MPPSVAVVRLPVGGGCGADMLLSTAREQHVVGRNRSALAQRCSLLFVCGRKASVALKLDGAVISPVSPAVDSVEWRIVGSVRRMGGRGGGGRGGVELENPARLSAVV